MKSQLLYKFQRRFISHLFIRHAGNPRKLCVAGSHVILSYWILKEWEVDFLISLLSMIGEIHHSLYNSFYHSNSVLNTSLSYCFTLHRIIWKYILYFSFSNTNTKRMHCVHLTVFRWSNGCKQRVVKIQSILAHALKLYDSHSRIQWSTWFNMMSLWNVIWIKHCQLYQTNW